ncbi:hypothetical protein [Cohnella caldifontis]|uniref:hypothetical protein n=1 Tax=Cohnella caldifontis TaxID=3027471 RepID=UPI0023ED6C75|nr:hypothetical protein [Cohnella sp. YIM B05605]
MPLRKWFRAIFLYFQPGGISTVRLSRMLGITYKTAWLMGHKIRHAMSTKDSLRKLTGLIRITPGRYGRVYNPTAFRHPQEHPVLIGASLTANGQAKYVKIKQVMSEDILIRSAGYGGLMKFIKTHAKNEAGEIISDLNRPLGERSKLLSHLGKAAFNWLNGTFRGIGPKHLQLYLDQFCCYENSRTRRQEISNQGLAYCSEMKRITLRQLVARPALIPVTAEYDRVMRLERSNGRSGSRGRSAS